MEKYSKTTENFIKCKVLKYLDYEQITEDNICEIVDFILDNYEIPLSQAQEAGENIDEELLESATKAVTEITSRRDW